jgi:hypothetical protein
LEFFSVFPPLGEPLGKNGPLAAMNPGAVEPCDGFPSDVPLRVEGPIGWDMDHRAMGRDGDGELEQKWLVALHPKEIPPHAEAIKGSVKRVVTAAASGVLKVG